MSHKLPSWDHARFEVLADMALLDRLTLDMESCQNQLFKPASWWMLPSELVNGTMNDLLNPWCGDIGQLPLSAPDEITRVSGNPEFITKHEDFLRLIDYLGWLEGINLPELAQANWRVMDLGSLMDYLLLSAYLDVSEGRLRVLEVGGGFGRMGEFLALAHEPGIQYVNIDAVPASLMYCYQYLRHRFPQSKVVMFSPDVDIDADFDFMVVPAWHVDKLSLSNFDLAINIESMQEMSQDLVDYYLSYFDKKVKDGGEIYLVNSREYKFRGTWNLPKNWQCLFRHRTPRSWTVNHPAEVFRKTRTDQKKQNRLREALFFQELKHAQGN